MLDVIYGLQFAVDNKAAYNIRVVNLSLESTTPNSYKTDPLDAAVESAWLKGLVPTTENLAQAVWERLRPELPDGLLRSVRVWETDKNWAEVGDQA